MIADILNGPSPFLCWPALPQRRAGWRRNRPPERAARPHTVDGPRLAQLRL